MSGMQPPFNPMPPLQPLPSIVPEPIMPSMYPGPIRLEEIQERIRLGELEKALIHPDPNHKDPEGAHLDVKLWPKGCLKPESFKVKDEFMSRLMNGDIEL